MSSFKEDKQSVIIHLIYFNNIKYKNLRNSIDSDKEYPHCEETPTHSPPSQSPAFLPEKLESMRNWFLSLVVLLLAVVVVDATERGQNLGDWKEAHKQQFMRHRRQQVQSTAHHPHENEWGPPPEPVVRKTTAAANPSSTNHDRSNVHLPLRMQVRMV